MSVKVLQTNGGKTKHPSASKSGLEARVARKTRRSDARAKRETMQAVNLPLIRQCQKWLGWSYDNSKATQSQGSIQVGVCPAAQAPRSAGLPACCIADLQSAGVEAMGTREFILRPAD